MPTVIARHASEAPPQRVWEALAYSDSFPSYVPEIVAVDVLRQEADRRSSRWTVLLGAARLSWQEEATFDHAARRIDFAQTSGALASLAGHWLVEAEGTGSAVELALTFEAGIPLLDATLHPITEQALREFAEAVLGRIAERAAGTPATTA
ncbi:type II toxin-antitoxin system RatA family toxin [Streptomyces sp. CG1]|uniref:type II toxin-antitoxin system RatA family toxin n=1 Tax=Streptomyces sp. CG1 TaxID=1287523 RepID=UPI0034E252F6